MTHPYYDSRKRKQSQRESLKILAFTLPLAFMIFALPAVCRWERVNKIEVWVPYEVKILDKDKVVFFRSQDVSDSLVFRCNTDIFLGTEAIEKLEYKLP